MYRATDQILVDVVLQSDGRDVVYVVQSLLDLGLLPGLGIWLVKTANLLSIFILPNKYFSEQGTQTKEVIKV